MNTTVWAKPTDPVAETLLTKYGETFLRYSNLWEVERKLTPEEMRRARDMRDSWAKSV